MILSLNTRRINTSNPITAAWQVLCAVVMQRDKTLTRSVSSVEILGKGETLALEQPVGRCVECLQGCVWVTLDGDRRDVVISAGQSFWPDRNSRALVYALEASRIAVC